MRISNIYKSIGVIANILLFALIVVLLLLLKGSPEGTSSLNGAVIAILIVMTILGMASIYLFYKLTSSFIRNKYFEMFEKERTRQQLESKQEDVQIEEEETIVDHVFSLNELKEKLIPSSQFKYLDSFAEKLLINFGKHYNIVQGLFYYLTSDKKSYAIIARYASIREKEIEKVNKDDGLTGQAIADKKILAIDNIPSDYIKVESGLGAAMPAQLLIIPVLIKNKVMAVMEIATFKSFNDEQIERLSEFADVLGEHIQNYKTR
jgi:hypothetical protein